MELLLIFAVIVFVWGGYRCFVRQPIVATLFLIFMIPVFFFWAFVECILSIVD
jgi:hypothetical protein